MTGTVGILNVGAGDIKLSFDPDNAIELIRAKRIVKDMLRRGFALLVEVDDGKGGKRFQRALDFDDTSCSYIIADFDPMTAAAVDQEETLSHEESRQDKAEAAEADAPGDATRPTPKVQRGRPRKLVSATTTRAVAVARSAGG